MSTARADTRIFDLAVVGGGLAGSVAFARAAELGRSVVLIEKGEGSSYPCNTRFSGGVMHIAFRDLDSPIETLREAVAEIAGNYPAAEQAAVITANAGRLVAWLRGLGAEFQSGRVPWQRFIMAPSRRIAAGLDWHDRGPDRLLQLLQRHAAANGAHMLLATRAVALEMHGRECCGVHVQSSMGTSLIRANAVLIADGGFQSNLDLVARHIAPASARLKQRGGATGMGDGLSMARAAGAAITPLDRFYGHLLSRDAMTSDAVWPYPELDALALAGILVDASGRRLLDEGVGGVALANAIARLPDPLSTTIIVDEHIWEGPGRSARIPANPSLTDAGGTVHTAPTLSDLAARSGITPSGLAGTVAAYNAAVEARTLDRLSPRRSADRHRPMPIVTPPFRAIPVCAGITYTMGGIAVDGASRVLDPSGLPLAGLLAAGSATGGLEGGPDTVYLGGLVKAGVQGLLAAETVAAQDEASSQEGRSQ